MGNLSTHFPAPTSSNVLEVISYNCDGRTVNLNGTDYTAGTAAIHAGSTSDYDVSGSSIVYTPPSDTKAVIYEIDIISTGVDGTGIGHFWLDIDGTEVTRSRRTLRGTSWQQVLSFRFAIQVGVYTENLALGQVGTWTSDKTLKLRSREYSSSYESRTNDLTWWDGATANPRIAYSNLKITALK
jgi:hypothetical protein